MKKYFAVLLTTFLAVQCSAISFYEQLCAFNPNWKKYKFSVPIEEAHSFLSDKTYIQAHLATVLTVLQHNPTSHLSKAQKESRKRLLDELADYRVAGKFPINYYRQERIPVFIDPHNTYCAVGYLMKQSGYQDLAKRIAAADNYVWVKDIKDAQLSEWQQASGFSIEELKLIQGAYDSYIENAFFLPNKFEIPQKPACMVAYFDKNQFGIKLSQTEGNIWCKGEGENGKLHGKWEQNYAVGIPWIEGYYADGKRTGQWKEYYKGTKKLCRTEHWANDKLNGIRKRFDKNGKLIEEILFRDGKAIMKTNYDLQTSLTQVRIPIETELEWDQIYKIPENYGSRTSDQSLVWTKIYNAKGELLAAGHESVYNPSNLQWFQNIELTALNSVAISARSETILNSNLFQNASSTYLGRNGQSSLNLYEQPALVEYRKEGAWTYYKQSDDQGANSKNAGVGSYRFFEESFTPLTKPKIVQVQADYDSIQVVYEQNNIKDFQGFKEEYNIPNPPVSSVNDVSLKHHGKSKDKKIPQDSRQKDGVTIAEQQQEKSKVAPRNGPKRMVGRTLRLLGYATIVKYLLKPREIVVPK